MNHVFLADFGMGRLLSETRVFGTWTTNARSPSFKAPEKLRGKTITTAVDVYAVGGILVELFSGEQWHSTFPDFDL